MIQLAEWDTVNFGFKVGSIFINNLNNFNLANIKKEAKDKEYSLVYLKFNEKVNENLFRKERVFYEKRIFYGKIHDTPIYFTNDYHIKSYKQLSLTKDIYDLSFISGSFSRYKLDPMFPKHSFTTLYQKWIEQSVYTNFAKDVLVYEIDRKPIGLLTYTIEGSKSCIGLFAVNKNYRSQGIATKLLQYYNQILPSDVKMMKVTTQGINKPAMSCYEKNGYNIINEQYIIHYWL